MVYFNNYIITQEKGIIKIIKINNNTIQHNILYGYVPKEYITNAVLKTIINLPKFSEITIEEEK